MRSGSAPPVLNRASVLVQFRAYTSSSKCHACVKFDVASHFTNCCFASREVLPYIALQSLVFDSGIVVKTAGACVLCVSVMRGCGSVSKRFATHTGCRQRLTST